MKREGLAANSFDVALGRFNASHHQENAYETLVDLATALEAILAGGETATDALTLRLRNRTAALLATDQDTARAIFGDVGLLYGLRSQLVHGGQIKQSDLLRDLGKISTMPEAVSESRPGIANRVRGRPDARPRPAFDPCSAVPCRRAGCTVAVHREYWRRLAAL